MRIEDFLGLLARVHRGRIPLLCETPKGLTDRWDALQVVLTRHIPNPGRVRAFAEEMRTALRRLREQSLKYGDLSALVGHYGDLRGAFDKGLDDALKVCLLAVHDVYVFQRNGRSATRTTMHPNGSSEVCHQCGECCIGPAEGPISTSPRDLSLWEELGRDDLLYYTLPGSCAAPSRALSLRFDACPFLRFTRLDRGRCLVHPLKPIICREFSCARLTRNPPSALPPHSALGPRN